MLWKTNSILSTELYDDTTFYTKFLKDLHSARRRVIIESPFITRRRFYALLPTLQAMQRRGVKIVINTRSPREHDPSMQSQAAERVDVLQEVDVSVFYTTRLHRKVAVIDDITWEGSLNILSQFDSCEIMRRTKSQDYAERLIKFTKMTKWYNQG